MVSTYKAFTLPDHSLHLMHATLREHGFPCDAFEAHMRSLTLGREGTVSHQAEERAQRLFIAATGYRPDIWFAMGRRYTLATFGTFALFMMTAPNLARLISHPALFGVSFHNMTGTPVMKGREVIGIHLTAPACAPELRRLSLMVSIGSAVALYPELVGPAFCFDLMSLPDPDLANAIQPICGIPVQVSQTSRAPEEAMLLWRAELSQYPLRNANNTLHAVLEERFRRNVSPAASSPDFVKAVRFAIRRHVAHGDLMPLVAHDMALTARTLQRRLKQAGTSLRALTDDVRQEVVLGFLADPHISLTAIALACGFVDTTSLNHAFQRWFGLSPTAYRQNLRRQKQSGG